MALAALTDAVLLVGGYDLSGSTNHVEVDAEVDDNDVTNFKSGGWQEVRGGLAEAKITGEGFWQAGDDSAGGRFVDDIAGTNIGVADTPVTVAVSRADGSLAYFMQSLQGNYAIGDDVGKVMPWSADFGNRGRLVRGLLLHPPGTVRSSSGTGANYLVGTTPATSSVYMVLHVLAVAGATPSLTVVVERDDSVGFGSHTVVNTFTAATAIGSQWAKVAGPITPDDRYRVEWIITGTTPSFLFTVALGIAPT